MLDPIQNHGLRLCLGAFRTSPADSLAVEADELPLSIRRDKLALQYISKVAACPENPVHDIIFEPKYGGLFETKPSSIATFGIRYQDAVKDLKLHPENVAKFQFPETPPWTLTPLNINLEIAHAKKSDTNPAFYQAAHKEIVEIFSWI